MRFWSTKHWKKARDAECSQFPSPGWAHNLDISDRAAAVLTDLVRISAPSPGEADCQQGSAAPEFNCEWYLQTPSFTLGNGQPVLQPSAALTSATVSVVKLAFMCYRRLLLHMLFSVFWGYVASQPTEAAAATVRTFIQLTTDLFPSPSPFIQVILPKKSGFYLSFLDHACQRSPRAVSARKCISAEKVQLDVNQTDCTDIKIPGEENC